MIYRIFKPLIRIGLFFYYAKIKKRGLEHLSNDGPTILIANHPNTMLDGWLLGVLVNRPIYFMAKGTFFSSPLKRWLLSNFNMVPINRATEEKTKGVSNEDTFRACYDILGEGKTLVIFPEGNSFNERNLRELKTGTARIALEAQKIYGKSLNLKIIPIGLTYLKAEKFRSSVFIQVGKPMELDTYFDAYLDNSRNAAIRLTQEMREALERVLVTPQSKDQETLADDLYEVLKSKYRNDLGGNVEQDVNLLKRITLRLEELSLVQPYKIADIEQAASELKWKANRLHIRMDFLDRRFRSWMFLRQLVFSLIFIVVGFPLFLLGIVHNIVPYKVTDWTLSRLLDSVEYYAPLAILMGLVLYPLNYWGITYLVNHFLVDLSAGMSIVYFFTMPLMGLYAYYFARYLKHVNLKVNFVFAFMNRTKSVQELKKDREALLAMIFEE